MDSATSTRLMSYRNYSGLSRETLAEKLGTVPKKIDEWETGISVPEAKDLESLAAVYGVTVDTLLYVDPDEVILDDFPQSPLESENRGSDDNDDDVEKPPFKLRNRKMKIIETFPIDAAAIVVYLFLGICFGLWHPGWIVFVCIPVVNSVIHAIRYRTLRKFNYLMLVVTVYLFLGCVYGYWHPAWVAFLTVPLFYLIV